MEAIMLLFTHPLFFVFLSMILYFLVQVSSGKFRPQIYEFSGPPSHPLIGCFVSFYQNRSRLLDWYTELLADSATSTIVVSRLGARRTIVTANPENVEYILKTNFNNFPKGKPFTEILGDFLGCGIFNVDGELWRTQRKLASHEFSTKSLREHFMNSLEEEVEKGLLPLMESLAMKGEVVDLQELLRRFAFNVICKVFLGVERCSLDPSSPLPPLTRAFDTASQISAMRGAAPVFIIWKIKRWLGIGSEQKLKVAVKEVHAYVMDIIETRKQKLDHHKSSGSILDQDQDLLTRLIMAGQEDEVTRDMVISFIMAGRDTTSAAMTWLFWLLSRHQNVEEDLVKEIEDNQTTMDFESFDFRLLKACLFESMRLFPPVAWDSKHAKVDDLLPDGTHVRVGDRVTYFPYGMGRMESLWGKDRLEFKPDRWFLEPDKEARSELKKVCPYKLPVFQAGPRVCLGKEMAFAQMKYVLASVLKRFKIRPVDSDEPVFVPRLTAHMAGGLNVLVRKRGTD
ncbi:cytochrome P450 94B3 [Argentina anserina]|uniref:cytochrome P450 94B3 n=1 Tax=Argentina anserina TaxID=57926 RepID=UPI0021762938|nr:cytochrome P450 94B3 [Potentilla anserina]